MAVVEIKLEDDLKENADQLFTSLGLDLATAVRIFLQISVENDGIPFPVSHMRRHSDLDQAISDTLQRRNLFGPYNSAEEAVASMLED